LVVKKVIPLVDALTGGSVKINHLDGRELNYTWDNAEIISGEDWYKVEGEGMPIVGHSHNGSLYIHFKILYPKKLSTKQQQMVRSILTSSEPLSQNEEKEHLIHKVPPEERTRVKNQKNINTKKNIHTDFTESEGKAEQEVPQCSQM